MPQMAPIIWTQLFIFFTLMLLIMYISTFFMIKMSPYNKKNIFNLPNKNWMW